MSVLTTNVFEVDKTNLAKTRVTNQKINTELAENEVLLAIDKFALTANNISYGITGDSLGYWHFFPSTDNWGRIPAMGYARVVASHCADIEVGERVWGFFPMASHVKILAGSVSRSGFKDISPHRKGLAPVYATFDRVSANPFYRADREDFELLLRGLFTTSWLVDDFMFENDYFGADQYLITSASSKTSIALAFAIRERNEKTSVGITSRSNRAFVEGLGCYDHVVTYGEMESLGGAKPSVLVDMAGSFTTLMAIHQHFNEQLRYSCKIGATHHHDLSGEGNLPGVKPIFFFAPTQIQKRTKDWGHSEVMKRLGAALVRYIEFGHSILTVKHSHTNTEIETVFQGVLSGQAQASVGHIVSLSGR